ncbi:MAG: transporter [Chloroflexi bacterium]|nr:transporter [Chloroflexota bacterium]MCL5273315.1 transporter [Chloroflexota bacterium]
MIALLTENPLVLLFVVTAIGYPLGQIKIRGTSLGVSAVLFAGLAVGALDPNLKLPEIIYTLGLALFVYAVGLSSGPGFVASFRRAGLRDNLLVIAVVLLAAALTVALAGALGIKPTFTAGMFTGSLTNTPALAAVLEYIKGAAPQSVSDQLALEPVVGYSVAYPMGVIGMLLAIYVLQRVWKVNYKGEAAALREYGVSNESLHNRTILVTQADAANQTIEALTRSCGWEVIFGRVKRGEQLSLASGQMRLQAGDLVSAVGALEELDKVAGCLGETSEQRLEYDVSEFEPRRIFVSNPRVAGRRLKDLNLQQQFGAIVTRVRRGDVDMLAQGNMVLEPGDRVRVVCHRQRMDAVSAFFGDSYRAISEIDVLTFSLGLTLGLLLGILPIPLPGGVTLKLGFAGGPLIVALILSAVGRTGPIVWSLPYGANLLLRQIGLILFLAAVGTRAGYAFVSTLSQGGGLVIFAAGALITCLTALAMLWAGYKLLKIPMGLLIGMLAGMQTQPAVLGFALEQTGNDLPNIGYAAVYPVAMIAKIVLAQVIITVLLR